MSLDFTFNSFLCGVLDSVRINPRYITESPIIRLRCAQCLGVNGLLFLGSTLLQGYFSSLLLPLYYLFWIFPLYVLSMVLSLFWIQDIFDEAYEISNRKREVKVKLAKISFFDTVANMIFRKGIIIIYMIQVMIVSYLPLYIGDVCSVILFCWLYSYNCFEYKIFALRLNTMESIQVFETNWAYYFGFGFIFTILLYMYPGLVNSGIFALFFPFLVLVSVEASPPSNQKLLEILKAKMEKSKIKKSLKVFSSTVKQEFSDTYLIRKMIKQKETGLIPSRIQMFWLPRKVYSFLIVKMQKFTTIE
ncbi:unnamed protein product [Moneuplotes crassus]|uniref:Uncharacterized protein n=1 Tax=Euplotes crassus TaxID=5936 RepID=A0AAD1XPD4_EUPCR|nr:unnamed protein product [Moneuplotes crassus]CAI2376379.1 unnamed protein product [Moneuplotes crassus]